MSQHDLIIANDSGVNVRSDINDALQALASSNKGSSRPVSAYAGQVWVKDDVTPWQVYCFDGAADILMGSINTSTHKFIPCMNGLSLAALIGDGSASTRHRNRLINGTFDIFQLWPATPGKGIVDGTRTVDMWVGLTEGGGYYQRLSNPENGQLKCHQLIQNQTIPKHIGVLQVVEAKNSQPDRGISVVLSARVRSNVSQAVRCAVLAWTGTADSVTKDVVNDWTSTNYTPGNFFIGSNLTVAVIGATTVNANTWTDIVPITGTAPSGLNNWMVMFWTQDAPPNGATLDLGKVQLEPGSVATPFARRPYAEELLLCQRYICKTFPIDVAIGDNAGVGGALQVGLVNALGVYGANWRFPVPMFRVPVVHTYNPFNYTFDNWASADGTVTSESYVGNIESTGCSIYTNGSASGGVWTPTSGQAKAMLIHAVAYADL